MKQEKPLHKEPAAAEAEENCTPKNAEFLRESFATEQECLVPKLKSSNRITHAGDRGEVNEQHFSDFLRKYLPNRYTVEKAIVLDSEGNVVSVNKNRYFVNSGFVYSFKVWL